MKLKYYKYTYKYQSMLEFIFNCCGGRKTINAFELERRACTDPNWSSPPIDHLQKLIQFIAGSDEQINPELSFDSLLAHLEEGQQRKNIPFVLKNLIILDGIVEQRLFLSRIGSYYNNQLIYMEGETSNKFIVGFKELIASYYIYVKEKAKNYSQQSKQLADPLTREQNLQKMNSIAILNQIRCCFNVQNLILGVNGKYKSGDKTLELVQFIFTLMLKTYIFCHSIVTLSLKVFAGRIPTMSKFDLEYIKKLTIYYNKQYIENFNFFLLSNKQIPVFQNCQYKDLAKTNEKMLQLIELQLQSIYDDPGICPQPELITDETFKQQSKAQIQKPQASELSSKFNSTFNIQIENQEEVHQQPLMDEEKVWRKQKFLAEEKGSEYFLSYVNNYSQLQQNPLKYEENTEIIEDCFLSPLQFLSFYGVSHKSQYNEEYNGEYDEDQGQEDESEGQDAEENEGGDEDEQQQEDENIDK